MDDDDEIVTIRPVAGHGTDVMEVRISCPDATGLGVDIARTMLDFGLKELQGDVSTDGKWAFLIFQVALVPGMRPRWAMLKKRLLSILPSTEQHIHQFYIWKEELMTHLEQQQFILQVTSYDRMGYLHDLVNALFECELACAKAHITTSPSNGVLDVFWICDYRKELPQERRCEEIIATLKKTLGQPDANISISTPTQDSDQPDSHSVSVRRTACKDAKPTQTLRQRGHSRSGSNESLNFGSSTWGDAEQQRSMDGVKVSIDNCTAATATILQICCRDRKGLLYDLMRTLKDNSLRVTYAKVSVKSNSICFIDVFVQEIHGGRVTDEHMLQCLVEQMCDSAANPIKVGTKDLYDGMCTELAVVASVDAGGRGRPKVTYDVTHALSKFRVCVFMADIYIESVMDRSGAPKLQEVHKFLLHDRHGNALSTESKRYVTQLVRSALLGHPPPAMEPPPQPPREPAPPVAAAVENPADPQFHNAKQFPSHQAVKVSSALAGSLMGPKNLSGWNRKW